MPQTRSRCFSARAIEAIADADEQVKGLGRDPVYAVERMIAVIAERGETR